MRVLVLSHAAGTPISQQFFASIERHTGWELTIVTPSNWRSEYGHRIHIDRLAGLAAAILPMPTCLAGNIPLHAYASTFRSILRRAQPDAIYVHHEPYAIATAQLYLANLSLARRPIGFYSAQNICKRYPTPFRQMEQWVYRHSDYAFPITGEVEGVLRGKGYQGLSVLLPLGVDERGYDPSLRSNELRAALGASRETCLVGFVGRLVPEKGLRTLFAALGILRDLPMRVAIVGSGPLEEELRQLSTSACIADRVTFTGYVDPADAPRYLASLDVLALPSESQSNWKEQFGRVITEALASGTPVLGSDSGEIPRLIALTGGGVVFKEGDAGDCARALRKLVIDAPLRAELSRRGRAIVLEKYTHDAIVPAFAHVIESVVAAHANVG